MEVTGTIQKIKETQAFGTGDFIKRDMILLTAEMYPQPICIEFVKDKCDLLNKVSEGDKVSVSINLRGKEWINPKGEAVYFNTIQGWRIEAMQEPEKVTNAEVVAKAKGNDNEPDDLPF